MTCVVSLGVLVACSAHLLQVGLYVHYNMLTSLLVGQFWASDLVTGVEVAAICFGAMEAGSSRFLLHHHSNFFIIHFYP